MRKWTGALLAAAMATAPAPALAQDEDQAAAEAAAAIAVANEAWEEAYNAGDAAGVAALYAEDATVMAPNMEPVTGREAIQALMQAGFDAAPGFTTALETTSLEVAGDMAIEVGRYVAMDADGGHADHGPYMATWEKVDGEWKLAADIWNSSMPAPGAGS
ncbi:MAG TPA: nuclear transport factor 2 family protein [Longimicrobiales bacterium]|nr:nuclear transport factor 2 family protein [Longimicrobiales bacterium]